MYGEWSLFFLLFEGLIISERGMYILFCGLCVFDIARADAQCKNDAQTPVRREVG